MAFIDAAESMLPKRVGLLTTTQFRAWLPAIQAHLEEKGHVIRIGEPDRRVAYAGQLLGCDYHTATVVERDVDGYLYVGTGDFHPLGVAILVDKPVIIADPERGTARDLKEVRDRILRKRHAAIVRAQDASVFGIIVSKKIGQARLDMATGLKALAEKHGKQANLFLMDLVGPELLQLGHRSFIVSFETPGRFRDRARGPRGSDVLLDLHPESPFGLVVPEVQIRSPADCEKVHATSNLHGRSEDVMVI